MANTFETITIDNTAITALELLKLARETQLKIESKASSNYFKNKNEKKIRLFADKLATEQLKTAYLDYLIRNLQEKKNK